MAGNVGSIPDQGTKIPHATKVAYHNSWAHTQQEEAPTPQLEDTLTPPYTHNEDPADLKKKKKTLYAIASFHLFDWQAPKF